MKLRFFVFRLAKKHVFIFKNKKNEQPYDAPSDISAKTFIQHCRLKEINTKSINCLVSVYVRYDLWKNSARKGNMQRKKIRPKLFDGALAWNCSARFKVEWVIEWLFSKNTTPVKKWEKTLIHVYFWQGCSRLFS